MAQPLPPAGCAPDPALVEALRARATAPGTGRITSIDHGGRRYWIKRVETLSLRWRLQKGDPMRALARERAALQALWARGAPVPPILAEGPSWFAMPDCGETLEAILRAPVHPARPAVFAAAGVALARLHAMRLAHGRPQPRDLCWDGEAIRFIDFERGSTRPASRLARALDVVQFVHALYAIDPRNTVDIDAFCEGYRAHDPDGLWQHAESLCRRLRWVEPLTRPIQRIEARKHRTRHVSEWQAVPLTLRRFGAAT